MSTQNQVSSKLEDASSQNLWSNALNTLALDIRNSLDLTKITRGDIVAKALEGAQEKRQLCAQKSFMFKRRNGSTIVLRDVVGKIVVWIEKFVAVGDAAIQYDPLHAAPAWAAFRFVLQMAVNDAKVFGRTIENLEEVSRLITRYAILEELYLRRRSSARDQLENMITSLYAELLMFLAKAGDYFRSSAKARLIKSIVTFSEDKHMAKIKALDGEILKFLEVFTLDIQMDTSTQVTAIRKIMASLDQPIRRLTDQSSNSAQVLQESLRLEVLRWLSPIPFSNHHKRHSERRIASSCRWLFDQDCYRKWWNDSSSSIFLLRGCLGAGKTTLASAVVDSFLENSSGNISAPIAYFYCSKNPAEDERSDPDEIMRSVLRQLTCKGGLSPTIDERILREFQNQKAVAKTDGFGMKRLQTAECIRIILNVTTASPATIVLDAVDEIPSNSRHLLMSAVNRIVRDSLSIVKVFVTSRDDTNVQILLPDALAFRVEKEYIKKDVDDFVHRELSLAIQNRRMLNGSISNDLKQTLLNVLVASAGEMFVLPARQIENLCRLKTEADVRDAMETIPKETLDELYEADFARIIRSGQHALGYATQVFSLLLCAHETLSPEAVIQAIVRPLSQHAETMTVTALLEICSNLVVLDSELNVLRFSHISFCEFLLTKETFMSYNTHSFAALSCLDICLEGLPTEMEADLSPQTNFRHYSAIYWPEHCSLTMANGATDLVASKMKEFIFDEDIVTLGFTDWIEQVTNLNDKIPRDHPLARELSSVVHSRGNPFFIACVFGLHPIVEYLADTTDYDWNQRNEVGQSGLYLAAATGRKRIVQHLLRHNVNVNTTGGKFGNALHAASFGGHTSIVELLLDHGADPRIGTRSAMDYAILADNENVALLLLADKFEISDQAEYDRVLQQTAEAGFADVVQLLQKKYGSLYGDLGSPRCRSVQVAILKGRTEVVERYMRKLNDSKTQIAKDAIATAALGGQDRMISFLVDQGLDLNEEGSLGTPLRAASIMCHESTVWLLLKLGANLHLAGLYGQPLQAAAMRGHEAITRALLNSGADVKSVGGLYGTALQAAAHRGHHKIVEILLDAGADVHQNGFSRDAIHAASEGGHEGIVRLFLERGLKVHSRMSEVMYEIPGPSARNILREASPGRSTVNGSTQESRPESSEWLAQASMMEPSQVIGMIRGAVDPKSEKLGPYGAYGGHTELRYPDWRTKNHLMCSAAANGHINVVELLLSHLGELLIPSSEIVTAFKEACVHGHYKIAVLCLPKQMDGADYLAVLEETALQGHLEVMELLIDHEHNISLVDLQERDEGDPTARTIMIAGSKGGRLPVIRRGLELVHERCTDAMSRQIYGEALTIAAYSRSTDVMNMMFQQIGEVTFEELTRVLKSVCAWGDEATVRSVLSQDAKNTLGVQQYSSGLKQASLKRNRSIVVYLLENHPEHRNIVIDPSTIIDVSGNGYIDILPFMIQNMRTTERFGKTLSQCLQAASRSGHEEVVQHLIRENADVNRLMKEVHRTSPEGRYSHLDCSRYEKLSALQAALLGFRRLGPKTSGEKLQLACSPSWTGADASSQERCIDVLLANGADPNETSSYKRYPLNIAAAYSTVGVVQKLIASGARVGSATEEYGTALEAAVGREIDSLPTIKAILDASKIGTSSDLGEARALDQALSFFDTDFGQFEYETSLANLLTSGPGAAVKFLLARLSNEKADDPRYCLLFQMVCVSGDRECVELLLQRDINVNLPGCYYGTALQAASRAGHIEIVERLLESGADVNTLHGAHDTALRAAVVGGHTDVVRHLIACSADVNLRYVKRRSNNHEHSCYSSERESDDDDHSGNEDSDDEKKEYLGDDHSDYEDSDDSSDGENSDGKDRHCDNNGSSDAARDSGFEEEYGSNSVLHLALTSNKGAIFESLLTAGADVNHAGPFQPHVLITACENGNLTSVELLLARGIGVNTPSKPDEHTHHIPCNEATPLIAACARGHFAVVQLLLDYGADIEMTNQLCPTPLVVAIRENNPGIIRLLLDADADVNHAHAECDTPLSQAAKDGRHELVEKLLSRGAIIGDSSTRHNALAQACENRQYPVIELLFESLSGTRVEADLCAEALSESIRGGDTEMAGLLLRRGATPSFDMLRQACSAGRVGVVELLVNTGIDINNDDGLDAPLLHVAASYLELDSVQYLLDRDANVALSSPRYGDPLMAALEGSTAPALGAWHEFHAALAIYDLSGKRIRRKPGPHRLKDCEHVVQSLLQAGVRIDTRVREFGNGLHLASYMGSEVIVRELLQRTKDIDTFGGYFESPLIAAVAGENENILELLLDRGFDVDHSSPKHGSAFHCARLGGNQELMKILQDHGAKVDADDAREDGPLEEGRPFGRRADERVYTRLAIVH